MHQFFQACSLSNCFPNYLCCGSVAYDLIPQT